MHKHIWPSFGAIKLQGNSLNLLWWSNGCMKSVWMSDILWVCVLTFYCWTNNTSSIPSNIQLLYIEPWELILVSRSLQFKCYHQWDSEQVYYDVCFMMRKGYNEEIGMYMDKSPIHLMISSWTIPYTSVWWNYHHAQAPQNRNVKCLNNQFLFQETISRPL